MAVYRFDSDIGDDHRLEIPAEIPPGPARIVVIPQTQDAEPYSEFQHLLKELASGPWHTRTKEDIDAELRRQRESWE